MEDKPIKKKGIPKGQTNNPNGRPVGSKNAVTYDVKKKLAEGVTPEFVMSVFSDIERIEDYDKKAKAKLKLLEFFVPKPKDPADATEESAFRKAFISHFLPSKD